MIDENDFTGARRRAAFVSLGTLMLVNVMSQLDRQIMSVLVEPIRKEFGFSDTEVGIVVGLAFAVFYTLAGLPLGRLADVTNRKLVVTSVLSFWSLATAACGFARGFWSLFAARVCVGIGEAGAAPAAQSILTETFPKAQMGRALSTYQMAIPIGIFVGVAGGGALADAFSWRQVFWIVGLPGLAVAGLVLLLLREPERGPQEELLPVPEVLRTLLGMASLRQLMLAASIQTMTLAATASFNFAFMLRVHDLTSSQAGLLIGAMTMLAGGFGTYLGGAVGDRLAPRDPRWRIGCLGLGAVVSVPFTVAAYLVDDLLLTIVLLTVGMVGTYMYAGASHACSQSLVGPRMRAMTAASMLFSMNLFGYGGGPVVAGVMSDLFGGEEALRYALALMNMLLLWAGVHYFLATRTYREDLADAAERV
ncbi:MAG: MFS transporter [Myxococcota bacterium]